MADLISWFDESDFPADSSPRPLQSFGKEGLSGSSNVDSRASFAVQPVAPDLPELALLHGITDCHLAHVEGQRRTRIWLDPLMLVLGQYTQRLTLENDGQSDAAGNNIHPDGVLECKYASALNAWRAAGFSTHSYCYDWRKSVLQAADRLGYFLGALPAVQAGKKVVLVCHSMGGLVAAAYAALSPSWNQIIEHCIFIGSPLAGSYNAPLAIMGQCESFQKMDRYSLRESLEDFQRMAAGFPGLIDLFPNPEVFPDAEPLFDIASWPGRVAPDSYWLTQSRNLKSIIWNSPIFEVSTHLISQGLPTVAKLEWNVDERICQPAQSSNLGDGSVLNRSSLHPDLLALKVSGEHGMLCVEQAVIDAVQAIAKRQDPELTKLTLDDLIEATNCEAEGIDVEGRTHPKPHFTASLRSLSRAESGQRTTEQRLEELTTCAISRDAAAVNRMSSGNFGDFDRLALRSGNYDWKNLLSLAVASELAYQCIPSMTRRTAMSAWGYEQCMTFDFRDTQGFVAWDEQQVLLSYRGSEKNLGDWLGNLNLSGVTYPGIGKVHRGFSSAFADAQPFVEQILDVAGVNTKKIWITGHSLGGALAVLAGAHYSRLLDIVGIVTFGQPKLGQLPLARHFDQYLAGRYLRVVNNRDVVPLVPPNYSHFGKLMHFDQDGNPRDYLVTVAGLRSMRSTDAADLLPAEVLELDESQFYELQRILKASTVEDTSTYGPAGKMTMRSPSWFSSILGISFADHSITDAYIPLLRDLESNTPR